MNCITHEEFLALGKPMEQYYVGRWAYISEVIGLVEEIAPSSVLELGPALFTVVKDADIMRLPEVDKWGVPRTVRTREYLHDATQFPWPVETKRYDLFIALQVFEHLVDSQVQAFQEVKRISKHAILSLPYKWDCPKDNANYPEHHMIDEEVIYGWTGQQPDRVIYIERTGDVVSKGPRIICLYHFG